MFEYERPLLALARTAGVERLFSGFGGDEILTTRSRDQHTGTIRAGRFFGALRRLAMEADPIEGFRLPRLGYRYARLLYRAGFPNPPHRQNWHRQQTLSRATRQTLLTPEFAAFALSSTPPRRPVQGETIAERQQFLIELGYHQERLESWAILGGRQGVRYVYPYLDRRIVEFARAIPSELYFRHGQPRYLYRQALGDALPEALKTKPKLPESYRVRQLVQHRYAALASPDVRERVAAAASPYVDTTKLLGELQHLARQDRTDWGQHLPIIVAMANAIQVLGIDPALNVRCRPVPEAPAPR